MARFANRTTESLLAVVVALLVAGCGSKSGGGTASNLLGPTTPTLTQEGSDELVVQVLTGFSIAGGDLQSALSGSTAAPTALAGASPMAAMWDTTFTTHGLIYHATRTFYDGSGNELPGYGPTARRLHWTSRASGTYSNESDTATVGHASRFDVLGIEPSQDTLVVNGQCLDTLMTHFQCLDGQTSRYMHWTGALTYQDVRALKSTLPSGGWPVSGFALLVITADRLRSSDPLDVEQHVSSFILVRFDGTSQPMVQVNACYYYRWNMVTGQITRM